jgi:hypothetical protein
MPRGPRPVRPRPIDHAFVASLSAYRAWPRIANERRLVVRNGHDRIRNRAFSLALHPRPDIDVKRRATNRVTSPPHPPAFRRVAGRTFRRKKGTTEDPLIGWRLRARHGACGWLSTTHLEVPRLLSMERRGDKKGTPYHRRQHEAEPSHEFHHHASAKKDESGPERTTAPHRINAL